MSELFSWIVDLLIILILVAGIRLFRTPKGARRGNHLAAFALALAMGVILLRNPILDPAIVLGALLVGSVAGMWVAVRVSMVQIPAMVAFQHGAGGVAAFLVSYLELTRHAESLTVTGTVSGYLGLVIGAATFSGSMIASGKLAGLLRQTPTFLPLHNQILLGNALVIVGLSVVAWTTDPGALPLLLGSIILASVILGVVFSTRIGGADMPVLISFLNATAGLAASFCGIIISNRLLIAGGATVAASGTILTLVMLKAMNRSLVNVFVGIKLGPGGKRAAAGASAVVLPPGVGGAEPEDPFTEAVRALTEAERLIIVPGFGMAMAQAQFKLVELAGCLRDAGKEVRYAIHPLAGRMPGHMHVLLAEAEVPSSQLFDIKEINDDFASTDVALIVGACDVVNPAALDVEGTPISGMPILMAHQAGRVIVCNLDEKPGYSGVENPLYSENRAVLLFGDALATMDKLLAMVSSLGKGVPEGTRGHSLPPTSSPGAVAEDPYTEAVSSLKNAKSLIVIPGFGMAMAQAQFKLVELAVRLRNAGKEVRYAIHPLAGRMPGHMHVLLAEAQVPSSQLFDIKEINDDFPGTDVALIVGACDVVNPAALDVEGTSIYGMPILMAHQAGRVIVCNLDEGPGYSGVENPLYSENRAILLFGDAKTTVEKLLELVE
ncbi:MAG: NAD(P)(+) transhydrogenase (Re/Si-specific) subunit beta [Gemmatimonadales bacterium]|nr:MAG: NAD(P)(+) transhydrogenase (Re/Si-specific) subunit beta [Gemmatimonadales bacterium]